MWSAVPTRRISGRQIVYAEQSPAASPILEGSEGLSNRRSERRKSALLSDYLKIPSGESRSRRVGIGRGSGGCAPQKPKTLWAGGWEQGTCLFEIVTKLDFVHLTSAAQDIGKYGWTVSEVLLACRVSHTTSNKSPTHNTGAHESERVHPDT